jgi:hypothetical protein
MILIDPEKPANPSRSGFGFFGWRTRRGGDVDMPRIPGREIGRAGVSVVSGSGTERRWNTGGNANNPPPRDLTAPSGAAPQPESPRETIKRHTERFNAASANKALHIIFGLTPSKGSTEEPVMSPLQRQFQPTAHIHLLCYFLHSAMNEPEQAEASLSTFFNDIRQQEANGYDINRKVINEDIIRPLVAKAVAVLEPK